MLKYLRPLLSDRFLDIVSFSGIVAVSLYTACMFVLPWFAGRGSWAYVQSIWYDWQALNVGVLAFASSVIALNISRFNAEKQRERNFLASKAFLPSALSELIAYFKSSASLLKMGWAAVDGKHAQLDVPVLPKEYRAIFRDCITHAAPDVGNYLSRMLVWLQVHDARMHSFVDQLNDNSFVNPNKHNLITYFYRLGQLQSLTSNLFDFARGESEFSAAPLDWDDFRNAYGNLDIWIDLIKIDEMMNLEAFTKRRIERSGGLDA